MLMFLFNRYTKRKCFSVLRALNLLQLFLLLKECDEKPVNSIKTVTNYELREDAEVFH